MKEIKKKFKFPLFLFPWQLWQSLSYPFQFFLAYLVPLDVDVTGNITAKIVGVWSEFNIFCTLVTVATAAILNFCNPQKESKNLLTPPFLVSMAAAAKFVQAIPIFLAYLVPLDVDAVPIKFHQFLFGE
jgi:hypothetical protein